METLRKIYGSVIGLICFALIMVILTDDILAVFSFPFISMLLGVFFDDPALNDHVRTSMIAILWLILVLSSVLYFLFVFVVSKKGIQTSIIGFILFLLLELFVISSLIQIDVSASRKFTMFGLLYLFYGFLLDMFRGLARRNNRDLNGIDK